MAVFLWYPWPQESQIIRVTSPDFNLDGVVDRIGSGLLYVDHGAHTPLVIIARKNGLFGWEHYPDWRQLIMSSFRFSISLRTATASLASYDDFRTRMTSNIEQLTGKAPRSKSVHPEANISQEQPKGPTKLGLRNHNCLFQRGISSKMSNV